MESVENLINKLAQHRQGRTIEAIAVTLWLAGFVVIGWAIYDGMTAERDRHERSDRASITQKD